MRWTRYAALPVFAAALACGLLVGCGDTGDPQAPAEATQTQAAESVDDAQLGKALDKIVYHGQKTSDDDGKCFVDAVRAAAISSEAEHELVKLNTDNWATAVAGVSKRVSQEDAQKLLGHDFRGAIDKCSGNVEKIDPKAEPVEAADPKAVENKETKPNTKPKYTIDEEIRTADQIEPGLISMFSSFGDQAQAETVKSASKCMAGEIYNAEFSQETLTFIAGGAPLGSGSVAEQIKNKDDRKLWQSPEFASKLSACTDAKKSSAVEESEER